MSSASCRRFFDRSQRGLYGINLLPESTTMGKKIWNANGNRQENWAAGSVAFI
jgi:hypothetical protein